MRKSVYHRFSVFSLEATNCKVFRKPEVADFFVLCLILCVLTPLHLLVKEAK